jgi:peptidoglycan hydrolase-like protein with peptidoglycan-binding domain
MARRALFVAAGAVVVAAATAAGAAWGPRYLPGWLPSGHPTQAASGVATGTAQVARTDIVSRQLVDGTLGFGGSFTVTSPGTPGSLTSSGPALVTWLPNAGDVVQRGQALYQVAGRPVPLFYGSVPLYRQLTTTVNGSDVTELEQNLIALGFGHGLAADGSFTSADAAAVKRWQAALGVTQTGVVNLGDLIFQPGALRVTTLHTTLGAPLPGGSVLEATGTTRIVDVQLDTSLQLSVRVGDPVTVTVPGIAQPVQGSVTDVGRVATTPQGSQNGGGSSGGQVHAVIDVTITIANPGQVTTSLDQAPVQVAIADTSHHNVLAVPVEALVATSAGHYAVYVLHGDHRALIAVTPGLFDQSGLVEISGTGISEGMTVQVPNQQ